MTPLERAKALLQSDGTGEDRKREKREKRERKREKRELKEQREQEERRRQAEEERRLRVEEERRQAEEQERYRKISKTLLVAVSLIVTVVGFYAYKEVSSARAELEEAHRREVEEAHRQKKEAQYEFRRLTSEIVTKESPGELITYHLFKKIKDVQKTEQKTEQKAKAKLKTIKAQGVDYSALSKGKGAPSAPIDEQTKLILSGLWLGACFFLQRVFEKFFQDKGYALLTVCAAGFLLAFFTANYFLLGGSVTGGLMGSVGDRG